MKMGTKDEITVLCTTRPNKVADFNKYVPDNFHLVHVKILGIEEKKRADLLTRYNKALPIQNKDISGLLRYLARNDSRMQSHWRFPFNLVLVTILWLSDPNAVNDLTTATELFKKTHDFCVQKLLKRLSDHEETRILEIAELKQKVEKFLKKFCKEAFINHCGDNMVLSNSSIQRLQEACRFLSLPSKEVLGAFLIQTTSLADVEEEYSFSHKSLQDFYSALHVMEILTRHETGLNVPSIISGIETLLLHEDVPKDVSSCLLSDCTNTLKEYQLASTKGPLTINSVLEKATKDASLFYNEKEEKMDLAKYQNIIVHLTGLLHLREKPLEEDRSTELVELLKSTGIRDTSQWLDLVSEVKCSTKVSELLTKAMDLTGVVEISDCHLTAFRRVLRHVQLERLVLNITGDPENVPCLRELLVAIEDKEWEVWLWLKHDFRHRRDEKTAIDDIFQQVLRSARLRVTWFQGRLSEAAVAALPSSLKDLRLAVAGDQHYRALLPALSSLPQRLGCLHLHVPARLDADLLRPLPDVRILQLYVSGVEEATVESASRVVRALQPSRGKWGLLFPGVLECEEVFTRLVGHLARQGVQAQGWGLIASPRIDEERERRQRDLVSRKLGCDFRTWDEEDIWRSYF
ncbi:uncharacterized protein LOC125038289 isoform X2 [Penaeus chinensis]|uniref:uncharacterized protein LOC125038289 isoform X2 n=1 Tax=Penaeus chinensis TaxID=139456 RepID=UPI001FB7FDBF|nr:uncharacterized protein LOC125038289 isoform X2 [Penaeus chinensis]